MKLISHRGNINGRDESRENHPEYIQSALDKGYDVEIDVWLTSYNQFYLGHDKPQYFVKSEFLEKDGLWCHAKNIDALYKMNLNSSIHCFWHQEDDVTLTSKGYLWTYPGKKLTKNSIAVLPESELNIEVSGICSDFITKYRRQK